MQSPTLEASSSYQLYTRAQGCTLQMRGLHFDRRVAGRGYGYVGASRVRHKNDLYLTVRVRRTEWLPVLAKILQVENSLCPASCPKMMPQTIAATPTAMLKIATEILAWTRIPEMIKPTFETRHDSERQYITMPHDLGEPSDQLSTRPTSQRLLVRVARSQF